MSVSGCSHLWPPLGLILAAGASTRMGRPKALLELTNKPLLSEHIHRLQRVGLRPRVVLGYHGTQIQDALHLPDELLIFNPSPEQGQFSSLRCGLRALVESLYRDTQTDLFLKERTDEPLRQLSEQHVTPSAPYVLLTPVDVPPIHADVLGQLLRAGASLAPDKALIPTWQGRDGHPILLGPELVLACLREPSPPHLHAVLAATENHPRLEVQDEQVIFNLNTPQEVERWRERHRVSS